MNPECGSLIKQRLLSGETVVGIWSILPSPMLAEVFSFGGFDFQILDMEHGAFDFRDIGDSIRVIDAAGSSPIVRVPSADGPTVQRCLDLGAQGIVFPQIDGRESVLDACRTLRYAPQGRRGFNPFTRAGRYLGKISDSTPALKNGFALNVVIVENRGAAASLKTIADMEEVDVLYLGVYDMSIALGCRGDVSHPKVVRFVEASAKIARKAGKALGLMARTPHEVRRAVSLGTNFIVYGVDTTFVRNSTADVVAQVRDAARFSR